MALKESLIDRIRRIISVIPTEEEDVFDETCEFSDASDCYGFEVSDILLLLRKAEVSWSGSSRCLLPLFKSADGRVYVKPHIEGKTVKVFLTDGSEA